MVDAASVENLFRETSDLVVVLNTDRRVRAANAAFRDGVDGGNPGVDFLALVPAESRDHVGRELAKAAGGATVLVEVPHDGPGGRRPVVEYRFFPVDGGLVAGIGRVRATMPEVVEEPTGEQRLGR